MEKLQLVFVPAPAMGHFISAVEAAKLLVNRYNHLSITILVMKLSNFDSKVNDYLQSTTAASATTSDRIRFTELPKDEPEIFTFASFIERQKPHVKEAVSKIIQSESSSDSPRLAGFVLDWFYTAMMDVANEFCVPSYVFFTSSVAFLGFVNHLQVICDDKKIDPSELKESNAELEVPCLVNLFPGKVMPSIVLSERWLYPLLDNFRRFKETKGIIVNTFLELESYAVESFSDDKINNIPTVYPVGPILNVGSHEINNKQQEIMQWLDDQPLASVVFLCFGSVGSFSEDQVKEIACALEHSRHRFLWSLRRRPPQPVNKIKLPSDYEDIQEVLPKGFLDRTIGIGKIIGWAPQATILAHSAIGGFISHCGWNSVLESIWYGVPIATWPMYAEQQFNAFEMVIELGLAVEIKIDYMMDSGIIMSSNEIERGIKCVMEQDSEVRKKVKEMSEKGRAALIQGGSSYFYLDRLIKDIMNNIIM